MTNRKTATWADRRWKLFEQAVANNASFKGELLEVRLTTRNNQLIYDDKFDLLSDLLVKYSIPTACLLAVGLYVCNPNLKRDKYLENIIPPFVLWDTGTGTVSFGSAFQGPSFAEYLEKLIKLAQSEGQISFDVNNINYVELANALHRNPSIEIMPNTNVTELRDFINEHWGKIEKAIDVPALEGDYSYTPALLEKMQPSKVTGKAERDQLIMKFADEGVSVKDTIARLVASGHATEKALTAENVRQIRYNERRRANLR